MPKLSQENLGMAYESGSIKVPRACPRGYFPLFPPKRFTSFKIYPRGFSLIELLVVMVIIGSLAALSLPRFRNTYNNLRFDNFCQNLLSRMRYLQERASVEQTNYRLNFDLDNKIIKSELMDESTQGFIDAKGFLSRKITIPPEIEIEIEEPYIYFYPDASIEGSDIEILGDQSRATIYIKESIGQFQLQKEYE